MILGFGRDDPWLSSVALGHAGSGAVSSIATLTDPGSVDGYAAVFSPDGRTLATADQNGRTYLRDIPGRGSAS